MKTRNLTSKFSLFVILLLMMFVIVACSGGGDTSSDTSDTTTIEDTTSDDAATDEVEEVEAEEADNEAETADDESEADETSEEDGTSDEAETEEEASAEGETRVVITGLTSEEEVEVEEGYPCDLVAVVDSEGQSGSRIRNIILNDSAVGSVSIRTVVNGEELVADEHLINDEGVWYRLVVNNTVFYGWIQEQYVALSPECPFYDYEE